MSQEIDSPLLGAAQSSDEILKFVEAFARVTVTRIRLELGSPLKEASEIESQFHPNWDDEQALAKSGLVSSQVDASAREGKKYLHYDVAIRLDSLGLRQLFLSFTGLSDKQQRILFPSIKSRTPDPEKLQVEVPRLNAWLDEVRSDGFDPSAFVTYQRSIGIHGAGQNLSGAIGAAGAAIAFVDAIRELDPSAIVDTVGVIPPAEITTPSEVYEWLQGDEGRTLRAVLLSNGRALVFASSKDANIFEPLGGAAFTSAADALNRFNAVAKDQRKRKQQLHEHAVGEVKTATDPNNLHERMGLASRETQTELRTDRFLMMAILNREILTGGTQKRVMNNRDLTRFTHVFNLHHCWGWDGGRQRHSEHWEAFKACVSEWCGLPSN